MHLGRLSYGQRQASLFVLDELAIEVQHKEAPKACRNFIALALEGYYDGVIFHRVIPDFLIQTGDRTGSGAGGESFYGGENSEYVLGHVLNVSQNHFPMRYIRVSGLRTVAWSDARMVAKRTATTLNFSSR